MVTLNAMFHCEFLHRYNTFLPSTLTVPLSYHPLCHGDERTNWPCDRLVVVQPCLHLFDSVGNCPTIDSSTWHDVYQENQCVWSRVHNVLPNVHIYHRPTIFEGYQLCLFEGRVFSLSGWKWQRLISCLCATLLEDNHASHGHHGWRLLLPQHVLGHNSE